MDGTINISPIEQSIIEFVRKLRLDKNQTQEDIANILGVKQSYIASVESSKSRAKYNVNHINLLADHFGISPKDFLPIKPMF